MSSLTSAVASDQFANDWRNALHGDGNGDQKNSWEHLRRLPGGLYDRLHTVLKQLRPPSAISLACGDGTMECNVSAMGVHDIRAFDINGALLRVAEDNFRRRFPLPKHAHRRFSTAVLDIGADFDIGTQARLVTNQSSAMFMDEAQIDGLLRSARKCVAPDGRFWFSFTAFDQGVGTYRRKRHQLELLTGASEPDGGDPVPFAYKRRDGAEGQNAPEYFRPKWWWDVKIGEHGWRIDQFQPLSVPLDVVNLRQDKYFPGARTYDVYVLALQ